MKFRILHLAQTSFAAQTPLLTRFLITMNLTRLGAMQMDGMAAPKRLDMVIRSAAPVEV